MRLHLAGILAAIFTGAASCAQAQVFNVTFLEPAGSITSYGIAAGSGQQGGNYNGAATGGADHAVIWSGTAGSFVDLHPAGFDSSNVNGVAGGQQVGDAEIVNTPYAVLWTGSAASIIDLSGGVASTAWATNGSQQVGTTFGVFKHAVLWSGTAASIVDLHPTGFDDSEALGIYGGQQVGDAVDSLGFAHAALWTGSSASFIDLTPSGYSDAAAFAAYGGLQGGVGAAAGNHALLWSGDASTAVDMSPSGFDESAILAMSAAGQAGGAIFGPDFIEHAIYWNGSAGSAVDLHGFLPAGYDQSEADGIDNSGNIVGAAFDALGVPHAVMWSPTTVPEPGAWCFLVGAAMSIPVLRRRKT